MTAAIQRDRNSGSPRGAHGDISGLAWPGTGILMDSAMSVARRLLRQRRDSTAEWPLPMAPRADEVDDQSGHQQYQRVTDLLHRVRPGKYDINKSDRCDQCRKGIEPHAKWQGHIRAANP